MSGISSIFPTGTIKSTQRGTISVNAGGGTGSNTATITSVDTNKAKIYFLGCTAGANISGMARVSLTNATTVTADVSGQGSTYVVGYQVVEYY